MTTTNVRAKCMHDTNHHDDDDDDGGTLTYSVWRFDTLVKLTGKVPVS